MLNDPVKGLLILLFVIDMNVFSLMFVQVIFQSDLTFLS